MELISWIKDLEFVDVLGFVAGIFTSVSMLPQLVKTYKKKKAEEVSLTILVVLMPAFVCGSGMEFKKKIIQL